MGTGARDLLLFSNVLFLKLNNGGSTRILIALLFIAFIRS